MSLKVTSTMQLTGVDTATGEFVDPNNATFTINGLNTTTELTGSTVPPVAKQSSGRAVMTAGAATIDLTSLPDKDGNAGAVTFLGLKLNLYKFINPGANDIVITFGASNPYLLHGTAFKYTLRPGEKMQFEGADLGPDVAAGAKNIDISGTLAQYLEYHLAAG